MSRDETLEEAATWFSNLTAGLRGVFQVANGEYLESITSDPHVSVWRKNGSKVIRRAVAAYFKYKYINVQVYLQSQAQHEVTKDLRHPSVCESEKRFALVPASGSKRDMHRSWEQGIIARRHLLWRHAQTNQCSCCRMAHGKPPHGSERFTKELKCTVTRKRTFAQAKGLFRVGSGTFSFLNNSGDNRYAPEWEFHYCG